MLRKGLCQERGRNMLLREIIVCASGLLFGTAAAAGAFALVTSIGVVPRMAGKTATAAHISLYENILIAGAIMGNIFSAFELVGFPVGAWILVMAGVGTGFFIGSFATALAEVLQVFPILFRRVGLKEGLNIGILFFAAGKVMGAWYAFAFLKQI